MNRTSLLIQALGVSVALSSALDCRAETLNHSYFDIEYSPRVESGTAQGTGLTLTFSSQSTGHVRAIGSVRRFILNEAQPTITFTSLSLGAGAVLPLSPALDLLGSFELVRLQPAGTVFSSQVDYGVRAGVGLQYRLNDKLTGELDWTSEHVNDPAQAVRARLLVKFASRWHVGLSAQRGEVFDYLGLVLRFQ